jgi:hypothetical protein
VFDVFTGVIYSVLTYGLVIYWPEIKKALAGHKHHRSGEAWAMK